MSVTTSAEYRYVTLMQCVGGNTAWGHEDGEYVLWFGKQPRHWTPNAHGRGCHPTVTAEYNRVGLLKLDKKRSPTHILAWIEFHQPNALSPWLDREQR